MKRIFLILISASVVISCSKGGGASAGKPGMKGELVPKGKSKSFVAERPYGMVAVPAGSYVMGMADQDFTNTPEKATLKTVTVSSFLNSDNTKVAVVMNRSGAKQKYSIRCGNRKFTYEQYDESVVTFKFK